MRPPHATATAETSSGRPDWFTGFQKSSRSADFLEAVSAIDKETPQMLELADTVRSTPFFRLYSVDMLASCAYFVQDIEACGLESCECFPVDERSVPTDVSEQDIEEFEFELDGWSRWDMPTEDYYDTSEYPEAYTTYDGREIWQFIHNKICFADSASDEWQYDFDRAVSGFHASVSAHIVQGMRDDELAGNVQDPNGLYPDAENDAMFQYKRRLRDQPGAVENLYFAYMLVAAAVNQAAERLELYNYADDDDTSVAVRALLASPLLKNSGVDGAGRNLRRHAADQEGMGLWQVRLRCRDLQAVMNCVQCSACRLHGKIGALGLASALQMLLGERGGGGDAARMHRVEVAAMITFLAKLAKAISIVSAFEDEIAAEAS